jgi:hypothetical protein
MAKTDKHEKHSVKIKDFFKYKSQQNNYTWTLIKIDK